PRVPVLFRFSTSRPASLSRLATSLPRPPLIPLSSFWVLSSAFLRRVTARSFFWTRARAAREAFGRADALADEAFRAVAFRADAFRAGALRAARFPVARFRGEGMEAPFVLDCERILRL